MSENTCKWCEHNPHGCNEDDCDFRKVDYEKDAIIKQVRTEVEWINEKKEVAADANKEEAMRLFGEITDKLKGIEIMVSRLKEEFEMTDEEVKEQCGFAESSTSFKMKAKLAAKMAKLKFMRGKK